MLRYQLVGKRLKNNLQGEPGVLLMFRALRSEATGTEDLAKPEPTTEFAEWVTKDEAAAYRIGQAFALEAR